MSDRPLLKPSGRGRVSASGTKRWGLRFMLRAAGSRQKDSPEEYQRRSTLPGTGVEERDRAVPELKIVLPLAAGLMCLAGCASAPLGGPPPFRDRTLDAVLIAPELCLEVRNEHWRRVEVWVEWPTLRRYFLGDIDSGGIGVFAVPGDLLRLHGDFRLFLRPRDSRDQFLTAPIDPNGLHRVEFTVRKVLANSRAIVM